MYWYRYIARSTIGRIELYNTLQFFQLCAQVKSLCKVVPVHPQRCHFGAWIGWLERKGYRIWERCPKNPKHVWVVSQVTSADFILGHDGFCKEFSKPETGEDAGWGEYMNREDSLPFTSISISIVSKVWVLSFSWKMMNCSSSQQWKVFQEKLVWVGKYPGMVCQTRLVLLEMVWNPRWTLFSACWKSTRSLDLTKEIYTHIF